MTRKASLFRLDADALGALGDLSKLLGRPMNKLVNEAVRDYLRTTTSKERELEATMANLRGFRERDRQVRESPPAYRVIPELADPIGAAREFTRLVSARFAVIGAILFGSRARGTHRVDSDVDVAVLLRGSRGKLVETSLQMADIAFDLLLETNVYIAPLPIWEDEWERPETHSNPQLLANIRQEGLPL